MIETSFAQFRSIFENQLQHDIPELIIPSSLTSVKFDYEPLFWIFDDSLVDGPAKIANLPLTGHICRFILRDAIVDTIDIFSLNHTECSKLLTRMDQYYNADYFKEHGFVFIEAVVESIFSLIVCLPESQDRSVYYSTLLIDLCRESLDKIPNVLGRCIKTLYSRLDSPVGSGGMDIQAVGRLVDFFATHLANFGFSWKWSDWQDVVDLPTTSAKLLFVRETFEKCIRLSYYDRIKNSIPAILADSPAVFPAVAPAHNFRYTVDLADPVFVQFASRINQHISSRDGENAIQDVLNEIESHSNDSNDMMDSGFMSRDILVECVMFQGSKSFSHVLTVIERHLGLLKRLNPTSEARLETVKTTARFWKNNTQFLEIILDKLINYRIVDPQSILAHFLSSEMISENRFYVVSIVKNLISKVNLKAEQIEAKLRTAQANDGEMSILC